VEGRHNDDEFKPKSEDVVARAKKLAKAAGTKRFKHFSSMPPGAQAEHLIEKGELEPPAETIEAAALTDEPAAVVEEPAAEAGA
jgi:hypothetical protein